MHPEGQGMWAGAQQQEVSQWVGSGGCQETLTFLWMGVGTL